MIHTEQILELRTQPEELEALYHRSQEQFGEALRQAHALHPDDLVIRAWATRLEAETSHRRRRNRRIPTGELVWMILLALGTGLAVRLPIVWVGAEWYYSRFAPMLVLLALVLYFQRRGLPPRMLRIGLPMALLCGCYSAFLPGTGDSVVMALLHLPLLWWLFLGYTFTAERWRDTEARLAYLRFNGELLVLGSLIALGGAVFSALSIGLFQLLWPRAENFYMENIAVLGAAAIPVVAVFLYDQVLQRRTKIAALLARVFAPLFLLMTVLYLLMALHLGQNPFVDRDFLILMNGLLLVVLAISVLSIANRDADSRWAIEDWITLGLLCVTSLIDLLALAAILFRLASFGFSPNRVVVTGANLIVLGHLVLILRAQFALLRRGDTSSLRQAATRYLPLYGIWAALVFFLLPLLFRFQ